MPAWLEPAWGEFLQRLEQDRLAHALLLSGPAGTGKLDLARQMMACLLCLQPSPGACGECRSCQLLTSGLGQTSRIEEISPAYNSNRIALIACIVFPRPISSARMAACRGYRKAIPRN